MPDETLPDDVPAGGRLDRTTMRTLGRRAATHPLVDSWAFEPDSISPRSLVISLDSTAYPDAVDTARIDIHWFVTNDYYVHYVETRGTSRYQCRWDRHPKTDAPRTHVHPPPDAGDAEPSALGAHHLDVLFTVLDHVTERVETLHDDVDHSA
ncbi:hypothetical protein [Halorubrum halophilum]|uniref:hypothetical protein n=1 Tax=Halorubrum halophilum TaxID=413816 RepID=UPI000679CA96|nr:hypothetical protein [Halorubrum halophilum]